MYVVILSSKVLIQLVRSQRNMIFSSLFTKPKYFSLHTNFSCRYRHTMQGVWKILFEFGAYNYNLHHHISMCQHQAWHRHDISSCICVKCVGARHWLGCRRLTHTEYVCTQEPHFHITYYKSSTAHRIHEKNVMHKIMCYDCQRQVKQVCSTYSKPALMWVQLHVSK